MSFAYNHCTKSLPSKPALQRTPTRNKSYTCGYCSKSCSQLSNLKAHIKIHTGEKPYSCEYCRKAFSQKSGLKAHLRTLCWEKPGEVFPKRLHSDNRLEINASETSATCSVGIECREKTFICEYCDKSFIEKYDLAYHLTTHVEESSRKLCSCEHCHETFESQHHLQSHFGVCPAANPSRSQADFDGGSNLANPFMPCIGKKPFVCEYCDKSFAAKCTLQSHLRTHTGEKPFRCEICEKTFAHRKTLQCHLRTHTGERPFSCEVCKKTFAHRQRLKYHLKTHTREKSFPCEYCEKTFMYEKTYQYHLRLHARQKGFSL